VEIPSTLPTMVENVNNIPEDMLPELVQDHEMRQVFKIPITYCFLVGIEDHNK